MTTTMKKEEVLSWLNDEESLVTSQRISQSSYSDGNGLQQQSSSLLSRKDGSNILKDVLLENEDGDGNNKNKYTPIVCTMKTTTVVNTSDEASSPYKRTGKHNKSY
jgi:hypothetical protein